MNEIDVEERGARYTSIAEERKWIRWDLYRRGRRKW